MWKVRAVGEVRHSGRLFVNIPKLSVIVASLLFLPFVASGADQIVLKNGDRLSGTIVRSDRKALLLKTEFVGDVTVQWDAIVGITAEQPVFVTSSEGQVLVGPLTTAGGILQVQTENAGRINVAKELVDTVRSKPEQDAYLAEIERLRDPSLLDFWSGTLDTGLSLTRGNADTTTFTNSMKTQRATQRDKISIYATSLYATSDSDGESRTTANAIRGGTRYDVNLGERLFTFGFIDLEFDEFQNLDLRNVLGGGLGWHIIKNDRTSFDFFSGGSFNQEYFADDITRKSAELVIGEEFNHTIMPGTVFTEKFSLFPNLSNTGSYRLQFDSGISTKLAEWLAWHVTLSDRFQSNPVPGVQKNDVLLTTGVRFAFGAAAK